jgi:hypothetical protein
MRNAQQLALALLITDLLTAVMTCVAGEIEYLPLMWWMLAGLGIAAMLLSAILLILDAIITDRGYTAQQQAVLRRVTAVPTALPGRPRSAEVISAGPLLAAAGSRPVVVPALSGAAAPHQGSVDRYATAYGRP